MKKKLILMTSTLLTSAAPIALAVSCGRDIKNSYIADVAVIIGSDGSIETSHFYHDVNAATADAAKLYGAKPGHVDMEKDITDIPEISKESLSIAHMFSTNGARLIVQPGFQNAFSILQNALNNPTSLFLGVAYSKHAIATKGFTDTKNEGTNLTLYDSAKNIGLIQLRTHETGFIAGYTATAKFFNDNPTKNAINYSAIGTHPYQDLSALMDGYLFGVREYLKAHTDKTGNKIAPKADGSYFLDSDADDYNDAQHAPIMANIKSNNIDLLMVSDPDIAPRYLEERSIKVINGGKDLTHADNSSYLSISRNWKEIMKNAVNTSLHSTFSFRRNYHDIVHFATLENKELQIFSDPADSTIVETAKNAFKRWEGSVQASPDAATNFLNVDKNGRLTSDLTCHGIPWLIDSYNLEAT